MTEVLLSVAVFFVGVVPWGVVYWLFCKNVECGPGELIYTWGQDEEQLTPDVDADYVDIPDPRDRHLAVDVFKGPRKTGITPPGGHAIVQLQSEPLELVVPGAVDRHATSSRLRVRVTIDLESGRDPARKAAVWLLATTPADRTRTFERLAEHAARQTWAQVDLELAKADPGRVDEAFASVLRESLRRFQFEASDAQLRAAG